MIRRWNYKTTCWKFPIRSSQDLNWEKSLEHKRKISNSKLNRLWTISAMEKFAQLIEEQALTKSSSDGMASLQVKIPGSHLRTCGKTLILCAWHTSRRRTLESKKCFTKTRRTTSSWKLTTHRFKCSLLTLRRRNWSHRRELLSKFRTSHLTSRRETPRATIHQGCKITKIQAKICRLTMLFLRNETNEAVKRKESYHRPVLTSLTSAPSAWTRIYQFRPSCSMKDKSISICTRKKPNSKGLACLMRQSSTPWSRKERFVTQEKQPSKGSAKSRQLQSIIKEIDSKLRAQLQLRMQLARTWIFPSTNSRVISALVQ